MKVDCIKNNKQIYFTAGKVDLYSDFDVTYFPAKHTDLYTITPERTKQLNDYFDEFRPLLNEGDLHFTITSGRTFGEFQTVADLIKSKGIQMPLPDTFIAKNGSDEYVRVAADSEYYNKGIFPFRYETVNTQKQEDIKNATGWHGKLKDKLREILQKHYLQIIDHESENSGRDYGQKSLMTHVKYDKFELKEGIDAKSEWKVGLRKDGSLKIYASFPYDMLHVGQRSYVYDKIKEEFEEYLKENGVKFVREEERDVHGGNRPVLVYTPQMADGSPLTKLYDTKEAVKKAIKNNDLVITAGDGKNDIEMLNPLNYIETSDLDTDLQKQLKNVSEDNIEEILKNQTVVERLRKLPFVGIIIKGEHSSLEQLVKHFEQFNRIIETEKGTLQEAIKQAIKKYAEECPEFAQNLKEDFKIQLEMAKETVREGTIETVKHTAETATSETPKGKGGKIAAIVAVITAGLSSTCYMLKKKPDKQS